MMNSLRFDFRSPSSWLSTRSPLRLILALMLIAGITGTATAQDRIAAQEDAVWVTMGGDVFDQLTLTPDVLPRTFALESYAARDGVVVTRLPAKGLRSVSEFMHTAAGRCSGFIVHDSFAEATAVLDSVGRSNRFALPSSFSLDQQTLVQQLVPQLDQNNIYSTIQHLSTFYNNRFHQNTSGEQSALWIRDLWQQYAAGRPDVTVTTYTHGGYVQPSVILTLDGTSLASEVVVLGGHLDSIKGGVDNTDPTTIAPGADDNASGIAVLSEVIRVLLDSGVTPDRTIKFMGYAAEEVGLLGSGDIAADFNAASTNVVGVMQLDMTGFNGSVEDIVLIDDFTNSELTAFLGTLIDAYQPALQWTLTSCGYACSDHASWTNQGFPAAFPFEARFGEHNSQAIHTSNDTLATLGDSAAHALKFAQLATAFAVEAGLTSSAVCGDGLKEGGEECDGSDLGGATCGTLGCSGGTLSCTASCTLDSSGCTGCPTVCGDGVCELGEDCNSCAADCISEPPVTPGCGNGVCEPGIGEDCLSCAADCRGRQSGKPGNRYCCGDGDGDTPVGCGDSRCNAGGFACSDTLPDGYCCGDLVCEDVEDNFNCAVDCGGCIASEPGVELTCGDGTDNDCDQLVDCDDPDCAGDAACACSLGGPGDACSSNADCCSNKCKGNGTCR